MFFPMKCYTHPKCNMGRDNHPFGEENHFPNHHLWNPMLVFRSVLGLHHCLQACSKEYGGPHPSLCMFLYVWPHFVGNFVTCNIQGTLSSRWWFQIVFIFALTWGNDPLWRIFFQVGWNLKHQQDKLLFKLPCRAFWNEDTVWPCRTSSEKAMVKNTNWELVKYQGVHSEPCFEQSIVLERLVIFLCWLWCFPFGCQK